MAFVLFRLKQELPSSYTFTNVCTCCNLGMHCLQQVLTYLFSFKLGTIINFEEMEICSRYLGSICVIFRGHLLAKLLTKKTLLATTDRRKKQVKFSCHHPAVNSFMIHAYIDKFGCADSLGML